VAEAWFWIKVPAGVWALAADDTTSAIARTTRSPADFLKVMPYHHPSALNMESILKRDYPLAGKLKNETSEASGAYFTWTR
jgi:hypothetical protein